MLPANIVNSNYSISVKSCLVNVGLDYGLKNNLSVIDMNGYLIGKTINIGKSNSNVQLITDNNFRVSVRVGEERTLGIFMPTHGKYGILEGVRKTTPLKIGDIAYTSGISEIYPDNIPVARIISISNQIEKPFQNIVVEILSSITDLDFVFIML